VLLSLRSDPGADVSGTRSRATVKLADTERKIRRLERIRQALETLIDACPGHGALREGSILDALTSFKPPGAAKRRE